MVLIKGLALALENHSWQEVLVPGEVLGGPSPWGNSRYSTFKTCEYLYYVQHIKRMRTEAYDKNLEIGGLYHEARARYSQAWLDNTDDNGEPKIFQKDIDDLCKLKGFEIINRAEEIVPEFAGMARRLYTAWLARHGPGTVGDRRKETYGVEVLLEVTTPFKYSARIDEWRWSQAAGGPEINEIKSAAAKTGLLLKSYNMDPQFIGQIYLWERVMRKQWGSLKQFTVDLVTKSVDNTVEQRTVPINSTLIKDWEKSMKSVYANLVQCQMTDVWPQRQGYRCRYCPAFDHCASGRKRFDGWVKKKKGEY